MNDRLPLSRDRLLLGKRVMRSWSKRVSTGLGNGEPYVPTQAEREEHEKITPTLEVVVCLVLWWRRGE